MITKDSIEQTYAFLHQKWRVYAFSQSESQKDDIEWAIASYVEVMNPKLFDLLAGNRNNYLCSHNTFAQDMQECLHRLEKML